MAGAPVGNKNAAKGKLWQSALFRQLAKKAADAGGKLDVEAGLDKVAEKVVDAAIDRGEEWAIIEIGNRCDGKPAQSHDLNAGPGGLSIAILTGDAARRVQAEQKKQSDD